MSAQQAVLERQEHLNLERREAELELRRNMVADRREHELQILQLQKDLQMAAFTHQEEMCKASKQRGDEDKVLQEKLRAEWEADKNSKDVKELPKLSDSDDLPVYLTRFRQVVVARGTDPKDWASLLVILLTGSFLTKISWTFQTCGTNDYELLHDRLLDRAGYSASDCAKSFLLPSKPSGVSWDSYVSTLKLKWNKLVQKCTLSLKLSMCYSKLDSLT